MNTQSMQLPVIAGHEITMDEHGRFNLNAIHRASGEGSHKLPSQWARRSDAQELVTELKSQSADLHFEPLSSTRGGAHRGTYAHELLAISYAGWISPKFQLQVNQVFLDYRKGKLEPLSDPKPEPLMLSPDEVSSMLAMCKHVKRASACWQFQVGPALQSLGSSHAASLHQSILAAATVAHMFQRRIGALPPGV